MGEQAPDPTLAALEELKTIRCVCITMYPTECTLWPTPPPSEVPCMAHIARADSESDEWVPPPSIPRSTRAFL